MISRRIEKRVGSKTYRAVLQHLADELARESPDVSEFAAKNAARSAALRVKIFDRALSSDDVRAYVGRSRPVVVKMAKKGELLAVLDGRALRFPEWQFADNSEDGVVPHLRDVLRVMDGSPFRKAAWFVTENPGLDDRTPAEALGNGDFQDVLREAKAVVES